MYYIAYIFSSNLDFRNIELASKIIKGIDVLLPYQIETKITFIYSRGGTHLSYLLPSFEQEYLRSVAALNKL